MLHVGSSWETKTILDICKRRNLAQGIGYTSDKRYQKTKRGNQVSSANSHSKEEWCHHSTRTRVMWMHWNSLRFGHHQKQCLSEVRGEGRMTLVHLFLPFPLSLIVFHLPSLVKICWQRSQGNPVHKADTNTPVLRRASQDQHQVGWFTRLLSSQLWFITEQR